MESLFSGIEYTKEKYDEFINFFKKHVNTEIIPIEEDMNDDHENNEDYPILSEVNQISTKPIKDESAASPIYP